MMKIMMPTAVATVLTMGAFMEAANAQFLIGGSRYSLSSCGPNIQFDLLNLTRSGGVPITDEDNSLQSGIFSNAIENFRYFDDASFGGERERTDFRLRFDVGKLEVTREENTVKYIFSSDRFERNINNVPEIVSGESNLLTFTVDISSFSEDDKENSVNDLLVIRERRLLASEYLQTIELSEVAEGNNDIVDNIIEGEQLRAILTGGNSSITPITVNIPEVDIPEPSTSVSLLALGALSAGFMRKRKMT